MKFPEDKKQRNQMFILIGLGVAIVLVVVYFGVSWLVGFKKSNEAKRVEFKDKIDAANREIDMKSKDEKLRKDVLEKTKDISDKYVLNPTLGSYVLPAAKKLAAYASAVNIVLENKDIREMGTSELGTDKGNPILQVYTARVGLQCSYNDLVRLLREIESSNPYVSVTDIAVAGRRETDKEKHSVQFEVQWLIWRDPEMPKKVADQLAATLPPSGKGDAK
jgi:hypothetical protein